VALFSAEEYNQICELLGSNWYAIAATCALAALMCIHVIYAFILTFQNRKARGNNKYEVTDKPAAVEWASQNMLVLGIIVCLGLLLHLKDFWCNMMWAEIIGAEGQFSPTDGFGWIKYTFSNPIFVVLYLIWIVAIWFHLTHGFWSALQTLGWNGKVWFTRWKVIGITYVTLLCAGFAIVVLWFFFEKMCCC
jgi:succinate dehydrogenase / fumarate reductase cytochrome b subunit